MKLFKILLFDQQVSCLSVIHTYIDDGDNIVTVRTSGKGPQWKKYLNSFRPSTIAHKKIHNHSLSATTRVPAFSLILKTFCRLIIGEESQFQ